MARELLPLMLLTFALLAGCSDGSDDGAGASDSTTTTASEPLPDTLATPTRLTPVNLGPGAGEPNIAVGLDGTIYAADPGINVWRSTDGARSFSRMSATNIEGGGDGDIVVDAAGRIHWLGLFGAAGPIPYQVSSDGGVTFSEAVDLSNETGSDREWLGGRPEGVLYASWRDSADGGIIATRTSFDGGATWQPRVTMAPDAVGGPIVPGPVPGQVYEAMTTFSESATPGEGQGGAIELARSFDNGATWDVVPVLVPPQSAQVGLIGFPTSIFPVVAADDAGTLYVVFSADQRALPQTVPKPAARFSVFLTVSKDLGQSWSIPEMLSDPDRVALMPWAAAGADGRLAVVWYENTLGNPADALPDLWNVKLWESIVADEPMPQSVTLQLNDQPNHIGAVCTSGTGCLAGDRSVLDFFEVAIQPNGNPVAVWAYSVAGTGIGVSAQGVDIYVGGVAEGTPLR